MTNPLDQDVSIREQVKLGLFAVVSAIRGQSPSNFRMMIVSTICWTLATALWLPMLWRLVS